MTKSILHADGLQRCPWPPITGLKDAGLIASQDFFERANEALAEKS
jgi:hypothetical protein